MTEPSPDDQTDQPEIPRAVVRSQAATRKSRIATKLWWLTALCAIVAVGLVIANSRNKGLAFTIDFQRGHGLKAGDTLRFRGIDVGSVTRVGLNADASGVEVEVLLSSGNEAIAVEGSQFWIERPRLQLGNLSGLETVLGAKYVGVIPGPQAAPRQLRFEGLETPLGLTDGTAREIRIRFPAGEGLAVGNPVRYRSVDVGEVMYVELSEDAESVWAGVRLVGRAQELARAGTQFWIERPRLDLTEVRGLDTLLGGRFIAMQPSGATGQIQTEFVGLGEAPPLPRRPGSLEIQLDAPRRMGLVRGAPVTYRGLEVGRVANVGLSGDGASVKIGVIIETEFVGLVRDNSKWWSAGGVQVDASLRGVNLTIESLAAWVRGGVAFATPPTPGDTVVTGHRFMLEPEPLPEWLDWRPRIAVGREINGEGLPQPVRVVASWRRSLLGLYARRTTQTWAIALDDSTLRVPTQFIDEAIDAGEEVVIELAGSSFDFVPKKGPNSVRLDSIRIPNSLVVDRWPRSRSSTRFSEDAIFLVVNPEVSEPIALDGTRLTHIENIGLRIAPGVSIADSLRGSPVVEAASGMLFGLLINDADGWLIAELKL